MKQCELLMIGLELENGEIKLSNADLRFMMEVLRRAQKENKELSVVVRPCPKVPYDVIQETLEKTMAGTHKMEWVPVEQSEDNP